MLFWNFGDTEVVSVIKVFFFKKIFVRSKWAVLVLLWNFEVFVSNQVGLYSMSVKICTHLLPLSPPWVELGEYSKESAFDTVSQALRHNIPALRCKFPCSLPHPEAATAAPSLDIQILPSPFSKEIWFCFILFLQSHSVLIFLTPSHCLCSFLMYLNCGAVSCVSNCPTLEW